MKNLFITLMSICFASCESNSSFVSSWRHPHSSLAKVNFKKVLVVTLVKYESPKRAIENRIAAINPVILNASYNYLNQQNLNLTQE
jgi:hypothetical protein